LNVSPSMVLRPSNLDVLVVYIKFLESFNNSKVNCELQNVMLDYSLFCFEKLHWSICTRIWVAFVVLYANPLPKGVALLFISCDRVLRNMEKQVDIAFQWQNFSPSFCLWQFQMLSLLPWILVFKHIDISQTTLKMIWWCQISLQYFDAYKRFRWFFLTLIILRPTLH